MKFSFSLLGLGLAFALLLSSVCLGATAPLYKSGNVLACANFNDGPGSSDMTLIVKLTGDAVVYIDEGHSVKYLYDPDNKGLVGWTAVGYNDSAWKSGTSGVGFADSDDNTTTPAGLMSIWTRYKFDASNADSISQLVLLADYDDDAIVWLNGVMIFKSAGAPAGDPPAYDATAGGSSNHGSTEMAAGKPNAARWNSGTVVKTVVDFTYDGPTAVEPGEKLAVTWGGLKK